MVQHDHDWEDAGPEDWTALFIRWLPIPERTRLRALTKCGKLNIYKLKWSTIKSAMTKVDQLEFPKFHQRQCPWAWELTLVSAAEVKELKTENLKLKREISQLKAQLANANKPGSSTD